MGFARHIIGFITALLFSVLGAVTMPMASTVSHQAEFFPLHAATVVEHTNVHFSVRAPPTTVPNVAVTGDVTVMQGSAFVTRGQQTVAALFGFGTDLDATNRGGLPDNGIDYGSISTAGPRQATAPRNLTEQSAWNGVVDNPSAGRPLNLSNDPRFRPEDGFQKMETSTLTDSGQRVTIHYQYNSNTGQPYDIKIVYPLNP